MKRKWTLFTAVSILVMMFAFLTVKHKQERTTNLFIKTFKGARGVASIDNTSNNSSLAPSSSKGEALPPQVGKKVEYKESDFLYSYSFSKDEKWFSKDLVKVINIDTKRFANAEEFKAAVGERKRILKNLEKASDDVNKLIVNELTTIAADDSGKKTPLFLVLAQVGNTHSVKYLEDYIVSKKSPFREIAHYEEKDMLMAETTLFSLAKSGNKEAEMSIWNLVEKASGFKQKLAINYLLENSNDKTKTLENLRKKIPSDIFEEIKSV